jgi:hypothetical protein
MTIKINNTEIPEYPKEFTVTVLDLDDSEATTRASDGTLTRDRVAVKRKVDISWGPLEWNKISLILSMMSGVFFDLYYPDPMAGIYVTKTFYVGNRPAPMLFEQNGKMLWSGLQVNLVEK